MLFFDRYDICEAFNLLAHDWGLYDVKTRLNNMGFKCSNFAEWYAGLTEKGQAIYDYHDALLIKRESSINSIFARF